MHMLFHITFSESDAKLLDRRWSKLNACRMVWINVQNVRLLSNFFHAHFWDIPDHGQSLGLFQFNSKLDRSKFSTTHLAHGYKKWLLLRKFLRSQVWASTCIFGCHAHLAESVLLDETIQNSSIFHKPTEWDICWWQF